MLSELPLDSYPKIHGHNTSVLIDSFGAMMFGQLTFYQLPKQYFHFIFKRLLTCNPVISVITVKHLVSLMAIKIARFTVSGAIFTTLHFLRNL